ncbi:hypothetical protein BC826DRAFT_1001431, partial [Russula brevipes]
GFLYFAMNTTGVASLKRWSAISDARNAFRSVSRVLGCASSQVHQGPLRSDATSKSQAQGTGRPFNVAATLSQLEDTLAGRMEILCSLNSIQ